MATLYIGDLKALSFEAIAQIPRDVKAQILRAQAVPVVEAQRNMAMRTFSGGTTADSSYAEPPVVTQAGGYIITSFQGVRQRKTSTRNAEIAFLNHYGVKGKNRETRFVDRANDQSADESAEAGADVLFQWQQKQLR